MEKSFEEIIGYSFKSEKLKGMALSHSSYVNENRLSPAESNERLEFLGDAVVELVVTEYLYGRYPELLDGDLTKLRACVVCEPTLAQRARELNLARELKLGRGEEQTGGADRPSILSDLFEAVTGAIYVDGGLEEARRFVLRELIPEIDEKRGSFLQIDAKTFLQEKLQKNGAVDISYDVISEEGPEHDKLFTVSVSLNGAVLGTGKGRSKKEAAQSAAAEALEKL